jgi:hypothetical protein
VQQSNHGMWLGLKAAPLTNVSVAVGKRSCEGICEDFHEVTSNPLILSSGLGQGWKMQDFHLSGQSTLYTGQNKLEL